MIDLEKYDYNLPEELIRRVGVEPRDSSRLFVYDTATDTITHSYFFDLAKFLPEQSVLVLNATTVVPARLWLRKPTGGKIEVFVLVNEMNSLLFSAEETRLPDGQGAGVRFDMLSNRPPTPALSKAGEKTQEIPILVDRRCEVGWQLAFPNGDCFEIVRQEENRFFAKLHSKKSLEELLDQYGETPIPHYLEQKEEIAEQAQDERERVLRKRYQTIFARTGASVAAPTASLHFTDDVFRSLDVRYIDRVEVTLNVGLGTFALLKDEYFQSGKLHSETVAVAEEAAQKINETKAAGRKIVSVGTTAMRTIESVVRDGRVQAFSGATDIFIYPPYQFQIADSLVTNFHLPKSSLMLLVDAFLEHKGAKRRIVELYEEAMREGYAFYSFGDSMLII